MRFKRFGAMLLALTMCMGVFSTTVFAYSDESATTTTTGKAETVETSPEKTEDIDSFNDMLCRFHLLHLRIAHRKHILCLRILLFIFMLSVFLRSVLFPCCFLRVHIN